MEDWRKENSGITSLTGLRQFSNTLIWTISRLLPMHLDLVLSHCRLIFVSGPRSVTSRRIENNGESFDKRWRLTTVNGFTLWQPDVAPQISKLYYTPPTTRRSKRWETTLVTMSWLWSEKWRWTKSEKRQLLEWQPRSRTGCLSNTELVVWKSVALRTRPWLHE